VINVERFEIAGLNCISVASRKMTGPPVSVAIFLHGFGAPGTDLVPLAGELLEQNSSQALHTTRFLFPEAPLEIEPGFDGKCWWPINMERMQMALAAGQVSDIADVVPAELPAARRKILEMVEWAKRHDRVAPERIILGGFSQGAMLAIDVALHLGGKIGGVCLWSGMLINQTEWKGLAVQARPMRIVQSHGLLDPVLPFACGQSLRKMLTESGHSVDFVRFQGYHQIPPQGLQKTAELVSSVASAPPAKVAETGG